MGDTNKNVSLKQTHQPNPILEPLFHALDPISLILNQNSHSEQQQQPFPLMLTSSDSFIMERGPKYNAYAELRETRLRMKCMRIQEQEHEEDLEPIIKLATPPTKQVKFQKGSLFIAQSVPDFSATLRKENRKPVNTTLPSMMEMTPPPPSKTKSFFSKGNGVLSSSRGSKSASAGEKKKGSGGGGAVLLMARKSYASIDDLKSLSSATAIAINGEGRGGRNNRVMGKTVSRHRQF